MNFRLRAALPVQVRVPYVRGDIVPNTTSSLAICVHIRSHSTSHGRGIVSVE